MYQLYEITNGIVVFIRSFYKQAEAIACADNQRKSWAFHGQDRHFKVSYAGMKVYEN